MSDVIRNAIIKLGVQLSTPNLKMPSLEPAIKQQERLNEAVKVSASVNKEAATAESDIAKARTAVADVTAKSTKEISASDIAAKGASESWQDYSARVYAAVQAQAVLTPSTDKLTKATESLTPNTESATLSAEKLAKANQELTKIYGEAGEGAVMFARGLTLLGLSQSDDFKKAVQMVAAFEGAVQVYKGGTKVLEQLAKAHAMLAVTEKAVEAGTKSTGAAASVAAAGFTTMNPLIIAATAALAAGGFAWKLYTDRVKAAADAEKKSAEQFKKDYEFRLDAIEKLNATKGDNRAIDERIIDLAPTDEGKLSRTSQALAQNQKLVDAQKKVSAEAPLDFVSAYVQSNRTDPLGSDNEAGAYKLIAEQTARRLAATKELRVLEEERVNLLAKERDLAVGINQRRQSEFEARANKAGPNTDAGKEAQASATAIGQQSDEIVAAHNIGMEAILRIMKTQNDKILALEGEVAGARKAALNRTR